MKKLLVATDFSEVARHAYVAAASLARAYDAAIQLVHEAEALPYLFYESLKAPFEYGDYHGQLEAKLDAEIGHPALKDSRVSAHLLTKGTNLVDFARDEGSDLIVMSTHGHSGLAHSLLGSFTERVARYSAAPVLTYRMKGEDSQVFEPRTVLVPFDFSENSKTVFPFVRLLGERYHGDVTFLHVHPEVPVRGDWGDVQHRLRVSAETVSGMEEELRNLCQQEIPNLKVSVDSRFGDAYREIIKEARVISPDLIVMATHGWTGLKHLYFGSVAEKVLRTSPCSVLTVRPEKVHEEQEVTC